jgi:leucyl aminopeptidase
MKYEVIDKKIDRIKADCEVVFVLKGKMEHRWVRDGNDLKFLKFKGESEQVAFIDGKKRLYLGIETLDHDEIREAASRAVRILKKTTCATIKVGLYFGQEVRENIISLVEGFGFGAYDFDKYKSKKNKTQELKIIISSEDYSNQGIDKLEVVEAVKFAKIISEAVNNVRDIVNQIPDEMTPDVLAQTAQAMAKAAGIKCSIFNEKYLLKNGMNAFYAVGRSSAHEPRLIHLVYKPKKAQRKFIFVGKGVTYDSGGLSLKPSDSMLTMKLDKSGAAAVIGILKAASELKLPFEIHGIIGATENMIGGNSYKPDDVLVAKNKKTIEVRNTDAEGRLVLADCLCYAQDFEPDYLVDLATLTGACMVALGEYTIGVMGYNKELKQRLLMAAEASGELAAELPFNKYLEKNIKSKVADISNLSSSRYGGAIIAALFLGEFIEDKNKDKWLHLDIAGPAYSEKEWSYHAYGASGAGVRIAIKFMEQFLIKKI